MTARFNLREVEAVRLGEDPPTPPSPWTLANFYESLLMMEKRTGSRPTTASAGRAFLAAMANECYPVRGPNNQALTREQYVDKTIKAAEAGELYIYGVRISCSEIDLCESAAPGRDECGGPSEQPDARRVPVGNGPHSVIGVPRGGGAEGLQPDRTTLLPRASREAGSHE